MDREERARAFREHQENFGSGKRPDTGEDQRPKRTLKRDEEPKRRWNGGILAAGIIMCAGVIVILGKAFGGSESVSESQSESTPEKVTVSATTSSESQGTSQTGSGESTTVSEPATEYTKQEESTNEVANQTDTSQKDWNGWPPVDTTKITIPGWITQDFLPVNDYSRPAVALDAVNDIVIHWVANPGSSAKANRDYFADLRIDSVNPEKVKASAHFVVGLDGEVIQCLPLYEMSYAVKDKRNPDTISIEVCHPDMNGQFSPVTYDSVVKLTAWLLDQFDLDNTHILRHHDITGKDCPKYYVNNPEAWEQFKEDVKNYREVNPQ